MTSSNAKMEIRKSRRLLSRKRVNLWQESFTVRVPGGSTRVRRVPRERRAERMRRPAVRDSGRGQAGLFARVDHRVGGQCDFFPVLERWQRVELGELLLELFFGCDDQPEGVLQWWSSQ